MRKGDIRFTVILEKEALGGYSVYVPALPGCASQGETRSQAIKNIKEAIDLYLWSLKEDGMPLPKRDLEFETVQIAA
jgi:predicted RNase H-like HicB family nuclease